MNRIKYFTLLLLSILISCSKGDKPEPTPPDNGHEWSKEIYPQASWKSVNPEKYGYKASIEEDLNSYLASKESTTGVVVVVGGEIIYKYGNLSELSYLASVRKSILAMMYGKYVEDGTVNLSKTMEELEIDDLKGLLPIEKSATILHCITARSGVYHPASNSGDDSKFAPQRGSKEPGSYFLYNNWDFNVAGTIFENLVGRNIYEILESDLALPLKFEDFDLSKQRKGGDLTISKYPAYHFYLSVRDMARIGYLMLREGKWDGKQIISKEWIKEITSLYTPLPEMNPPSRRTQSFGYGYMWWIWDGNENSGPFKDGYTAIGAGGQYITILPALDMVIAHKNSRADGSHNNYWQLLREIIATKNQ